MVPATLENHIIICKNLQQERERPSLANAIGQKEWLFQPITDKRVQFHSAYRAFMFQWVVGTFGI